MQLSLLCFLVLALSEDPPQSTFQLTPEIPLTFSGFAQVDASRSEIENDSDSSYSLSDGALYFQVGKDRLHLFADLPFSITEEDDFEYGSVKSQLYLMGNEANGVWWKIGKFDTIIGYESNDAAELRFSGTTLYAGSDLGTSNSGVILGYQRVNWNVYGMVSGKTDSGKFGGDIDLGAVFEWDLDLIDGYIGFIDGETPEGGSDLAIDLYLTRAWDRLQLQFEWIGYRPDRRADGEGLMVQVLWGDTDAQPAEPGDWTWGLRLERGDQLSSVDEGEAVTLGTSWHLNRHVRLKLEGAHFRERSRPGQARIEGDIWTLAGLFRF